MVTVRGKVKMYRSGALLLTIRRSTLGTTVQRYGVLDSARDVVPDTFGEALAYAYGSKVAHNAAGTTTPSRHAVILLSLASRSSLGRHNRVLGV
jgi:hypothetical protein